MKYNQAQYNEQRYNINGIYYVTSLVETITESDASQLATAIKALSDSLSVADATIFFSNDLGLADFIFMDEFLNIQFTNKALSDTIRMADWLSIERSPAQNEWYD